MKNKTTKKAPVASLSEAIKTETEKGSPVTTTQKHHKKPKKQYL